MRIAGIGATITGLVLGHPFGTILAAGGIILNLSNFFILA